MGFKEGWQAINMQMPDAVPRTEYSAHVHWELVEKVTGIDTKKIENRDRASAAFIKNWDFSLLWYANIHKNYLERFGKISNMGHAVYAESSAGGSDKDENTSVLFKDVDEALALDCTKFYGEFDQSELIATYEREYEAMCRDYPDTVNMGGVYITLVSGLTYVYGWEMFLECMSYEEFDRVMQSYYEWVKQFYEAFAKSNVPVLMMHDDITWTSGKFASRAWYDQNVLPYLKKLLEPCKRAGKKILFTSDGNYGEFTDAIVDCGADMLFFEPHSDMEGFAKKHGKTHGFVGDVDTRVLLSGSKEDIEREVKRVMEFGKRYPGFVMAVGNHIPPNTPVDNALWYDEFYRKYRAR